MDVQACFKIGYVARTHGLKGEITIMTLPDCPDLSGLGTVFIDKKGQLVPYFIQTSSIKGDKAFVKLEDVDTIDLATDLKGASIFLPKTERPKAGRGEFHNDEVIGFTVLEGARPLGTVKEVSEIGPGRFLLVDKKGKEILIPINGPFIKSVNKSAKKIKVELPEGFLDI